MRWLDLRYVVVSFSILLLLCIQLNSICLFWQISWLLCIKHYCLILLRIPMLLWLFRELLLLLLLTLFSIFISPSSTALRIQINIWVIPIIHEHICSCVMCHSNILPLLLLFLLQLLLLQWELLRVIILKDIWIRLNCLLCWICWNERHLSHSLWKRRYFILLHAEIRIIQA